MIVKNPATNNMNKEGQNKLPNMTQWHNCIKTNKCYIDNSILVNGGKLLEGGEKESF